MNWNYYRVEMQLDLHDKLKIAVVRCDMELEQAFRYYEKQAKQKYGDQVSHFDCMLLDKRSPRIAEYELVRNPPKPYSRKDDGREASRQTMQERADRSR